MSVVAPRELLPVFHLVSFALGHEADPPPLTASGLGEGIFPV